MSWHRIVTTLVILLAAVGLGLGTNLASVSAHTLQAPHSSQATFGPPKQGTKVILGDTSIDGPAIAPMGQNPAYVLAWTGTDAAHHLNLMTSTDGLHYGNKHILPEMSLWRPAVSFIGSARGDPYGTIVLAWTGTDPGRTLNVEYISVPGFTVTKKITLWGENSFTAPAVATISGDINTDVYLSWAGTDASHTLNVLHLSTNSTAQDKHILWGWSSGSRPNLAVDPTSNDSSVLLLSWMGVNRHITFANGAYTAEHANNVKWTMPSASPLSLQSAWAPSMIGVVSDSLPTHWLAWTGFGTTSTHSLNVAYTQHYPAWSDTNASVTLGEWAISSPELAFNRTISAQQLLIAWTGTDAAHHLNVAQIGV